ncbi:telomeric repeat-binding factor 2-interacting protein 1 [Labrus mixtus]|uniref:telomeric repeat-binding factor 2-interacting protein 1 n=1 Tax=Labrus mixtus TaxID=508554 RepID=UPI0029C02E6A|nr:telomeric repeat-binding factor 2-interacting protein 1 [Labrus mixtus]
MPSKQDVAKSISPVLFMSVDGEPMSFFLRPGPLKRELQPLITAGGGRLSSVQQPGAILLIDPKERGSITEATAHWYVSTQYIHDCVEKDEQLNLEDYRLNPEVAPNQSAKPNSNKESSPENLGGRSAYTSEDDSAILKFVSNHKSDVGGNRVWQEMEKQKVTGHSWQSMKYRYRIRLAKKHSEVVEEDTTKEDTDTAEGEIKVEENQETDVEKPSSDPPQIHSAEPDLTQIDSQSLLADTNQPDIVEAQMLVDEVVEEQLVSPHEQLTASSQLEALGAETSNVSQCEGPTLDSQADFHLFLTQTMEPESEEGQTITLTEKESVPEDSPAAHSLLLHDASSQKKSKERQKASPEPASPEPAQPQRRLTRRQLQLEESFGPEPYGKKLRSSSSSASSSPQPLRKTKRAVKAASQKDTTAKQPPSKRARRKNAAAVQESVAAVQEDLLEESGPANVQETAQPDVFPETICEAAQAETESCPVPHEGEKKTEKRKLGILEAATKEFEDDSRSDEEEVPDLQNQTETATKQPSSTDPTSDAAADAAPTKSDLEHGPDRQEGVPETQPSTSNCSPDTSCPQAAAAQAAQSEAANATCKPHLFIFDSESQEEDSQSVLGQDTVAPANQQLTVNKDAPYSLTQAQLEEDKRRITELMNQTNQDLVSVTKALLRTSGDFSAARDLLLTPGCISGPFWNRHDDGLLLSADPVVRQQLQGKYGEDDLAKRIVFLEAER